MNLVVSNPTGSTMILGKDHIGGTAIPQMRILMKADVPPDRQPAMSLYHTLGGVLILLGIGVAVFLYALLFA